jgi:hypothetical protein
MNAMELDEEKIDQAVLALLYLTRFGEDGAGAWKSHDWDALDRLHQKGLITDPKTKNKSVYFSEEGAAYAEEMCKMLFGKEE